MIVRILGEGQYDVSDEPIDCAERPRRPVEAPSRPVTRGRSTPRSPRCSTAYAQPATTREADSLEPSPT